MLIFLYQQLLLALAFRPTPSPLVWFPDPLTLRVKELRASDAQSEMWRSLALRRLQGKCSLFCGSITGFQCAIMSLHDGQEESSALGAILVTAIAGVQILGLHRSGDAELVAFASSSSPQGGSSTLMGLYYERTETRARIWWVVWTRKFLFRASILQCLIHRWASILRDWSHGQILG